MSDRGYTPKGVSMTPGLGLSPDCLAHMKAGERWDDD